MSSDAIKLKIENQFFKGKEGSNNRKIMKLLLNYGLYTQAGIKKKFEAGTTAHDRIYALKQDSLIEEKGKKPEGRNKQVLPLYWLSPYGLWVAVHDKDLESLAIEECRKIILQYWNTFTEIYRLDKVKSGRSTYRKFTKWLGSNNGIIQFLDTFGAWPLAGRGAALGTFRRMIDLALLRHHGAWLQTLPSYDVQYQYGKLQISSDNPYEMLAELAIKHERFKTLDKVFHDVDSPLHQYLDQVARDELIQKLTIPLGVDDAKKLATIPFFVNERTSNIGVSSEILNLLSPDIFFDLGTSIKIEKTRVVIETTDPENITPEWRDSCHLHVVPIMESKGIQGGRVVL